MASEILGPTNDPSEGLSWVGCWIGGLPVGRAFCEIGAGETWLASFLIIENPYLFVRELRKTFDIPNKFL